MHVRFGRVYGNPSVSSYSRHGVISIAHIVSRAGVQPAGYIEIFLKRKTTRRWFRLVRMWTLGLVDDFNVILDLAFMCVNSCKIRCPVSNGDKI